MRRVFICIGGNLGDRGDNLSETIDFLHFNVGDVLSRSDVFETEPWEMNDVPAFYNQVVCVETMMTNEQLVAEIKEIEAYYGRDRGTAKYASREMDVDILFIDDEIIDMPELQVPHHRMTQRRFVLEPLAQIAPDQIHPELKKTVLELLSACDDKHSVKKI
jgi:2-amino-4-hydroxy-6-hydroxymethyldihydropteridine diphosphokinase